MSVVEDYHRRLHRAHQLRGPHHLVSQSVVPLHPLVHLNHTPHLLEKYAILVHLKYLTRYLLLLFVVIMVDKKVTLIHLFRTLSLHRHPSLLHLI